MHQRILTYTALVLIVALIACRPSSNKGESKIETKSEGDSKYIMQGKILAQTAGGNLMGLLQKKINEEGISEAIGYCNLKALPVMDSLSSIYKAEIVRRSDRYRNPLNKPNEEEAEVIKEYLLKSQNNQSVEAVIREGKNGEKHFYAPIFIKPLCLNCHGVPKKDISENNLTTITKFYPTDLATGYKLGELRGIWRVTFK